MIEKLFLAGADVFRINMSHTTHQLLEELHGQIRSVEAKLLPADRHPRRSAGSENPHRRLRRRRGADRARVTIFTFDHRSGAGRCGTRVICRIPKFSPPSETGDNLLLNDGRLRVEITEACSPIG